MTQEEFDEIVAHVREMNRLRDASFPAPAAEECEAYQAHGSHAERGESQH